MRARLRAGRSQVAALRGAPRRKSTRPLRCTAPLRSGGTVESGLARMPSNEEFRARVAQGAPHESALMLTELIGYDALLVQAPDRARQLLDAQASIIQDCISRSPGIIAKATGATHLVEFPAAVGAARCALDIQFRVAARNASAPAGDRLAIRIGLHYAAVTPARGDLQGEGVDLLRQLGPKVPEVGGICISQAVRESLSDKPGFQFDDLGDTDLPGRKAAEHLYLISIAGGPARSESRDSWPGVPKRPPPSARKPFARPRAALAAAAVGVMSIGAVVIVAKMAERPQAQPAAAATPAAAAAEPSADSEPANPTRPPEATPAPASTTSAPAPTPAGAAGQQPPSEPPRADAPAAVPQPTGEAIAKPAEPSDSKVPRTTLQRLQDVLARIEKLPKARQKKLLPDLKQWKAVEQNMRLGRPGAKVNVRVLARLERSLDEADRQGPK